jgi:hypothetical protein
MSDSHRGHIVPTDSRRTDREIPRPDIRTADDADAADEDPTAAYCIACEKHLPHGTPPIRRVAADADGTILACARPECPGGQRRGSPFSSHTEAALAARRRRSRTAPEGTRK